MKKMLDGPRQRVGFAAYARIVHDGLSSVRFSPLTMPEPCEFSSLASCKERVLLVHKEADLAAYTVVGFVFQIGDVEKFPQVLGLASLESFLRVSKQGPYLTALEEEGGGKTLVTTCLRS